MQTHPFFDEVADEVADEAHPSPTLLFLLASQMVNQFGGTGGSSTVTAAGVQQLVIALAGIASQVILSSLYGVYHVVVSSTTSGAPMLTCDVEKRSAADDLYVKNAATLPAADGCAIGISWVPGGFLAISKSMMSFNGPYDVILVGKT